MAAAEWAGFEERAMRNYHLCCMNEWGRISHAEDIDASDDRRALERVREIRPNAQICEVWEDRRLVARIKSKVLVVDGA